MNLSGIAKAAAKVVFPNFRTRLMARRVLYYPVDTIDYAIGHRSRLTAPRGLWFVGGEISTPSMKNSLDTFKRSGD